MSDPEIARRMAALETRVEFIDQHGSRGVDSIRLQLTTVDRDIGKLQNAVDKIEGIVNGLKPARTWPTVIAYVVTVIPLYALVISLIVRA